MADTEKTERALKILLVDDEEIVHQTLVPFFRNCGHQVEEAWDGEAALSLIETHDYDLVVTDVRMPKLDGLSLLARVSETDADLAVVIVTGHGDMNLVVQALRLGAADFLTKPIKLIELDAVIEKAMRVRDWRRDRRRLHQTIAEIQSSAYHWGGGSRLVGESPAMNEIRARIRAAVEVDCETVLIQGETGTGKEVVAQELHLTGTKAGSPFIAVSCPALPETLVEAELFGHVKGSFTGATTDRAGCFEMAEGGTLFLDEVADLSPGAQAKLLRVLETRAVRRVGGTREFIVNLRVIAATNSPLEDLVQQKKFRQDLYFRLNVFNIEIPPLRLRRQDIIPLAQHFLSLYLAGRKLPIQGFSEPAQQALMDYDYPGNARELKNLIERAAILCRQGRIGPEHLTLPGGPSGADPASDSAGQDPEKNLILAALEQAKWNRQLAALNLGMPYSTLRYKIKKFGIA